MNENEFIAKTICEQLRKGSPLVLVSIIGLQGSTPRHAGARMVVGAGGKSYGTIGGSLLEASAVKESLAVLSAAQSKIMRFELTGKDTAAPGMICGGSVELLLEYLPPTEENKGFFRHWYDAIRLGNEFYFLTYLKGTAVAVLGHAILYPDGKLDGNPLPDGIGIASLKEELHNISTASVITAGDISVVVDRIRKFQTIYCFGAGHVAVPTAHIAALAGFRVVVVDDRPDFASIERFPDASRICVINNFNRALEGLDIDKDSFIVIATRGHHYDREVLEQAMKTSAGYIGMISSRKKREAIYRALTAAGVKKKDLDKVHSPIGIAIGGETPEEIAVSIVAELISERDKRP